MKTKYIACYLIVFFYTALYLQAQEEEVVIQIDSLTPNVYMLTGQGGNIGLYVGENYVFMIDDQFDRLSDKIKAAIGSITEKPIAFLLNTHMHGDHTGGNAKFNSEHTTIVAHDNVRLRVKEQQKQLLEEKKIDADHFDKMLPEVTFSDDITFHEGDETIMGIHVHNAHTDGDVLVYFLNNNVLHMGDTYFNGRYPYIDLNSGGSVDGYINAHKQALMLINDETIIIPGHGVPSNKTALTSYLAMLQEIKGNVLQAIEAGKTLEEVKEMSDLASKYDASHGGGFINAERMREIFYTSLSTK